MDKSKLIQALKLIKESFSTAQKFVDAKLNDGVTIIRYDGDKLDIGVPVLAVTEQGAIAIPDGDYTLEDGTAFSIAGGVVSAVTPVEAEKEVEAGKEKEAPAPAAAMTEAKAKSIIESVIKESHFTKDEINAMFAESVTVKETFATQKVESDKKVSDLESEVATQKETIKQMFSLLEEMAGEPSAAPTEKAAGSFSVKDFKKAYREDLQTINKKIN